MSVVFVSTGSQDGFPVEVAHSGQTATIVRQLTENEVDVPEVGWMYRIRFADGVEVDAFEDELTPMPDASEWFGLRDG